MGTKTYREFNLNSYLYGIPMSLRVPHLEVRLVGIEVGIAKLWATLKSSDNEAIRLSCRRHLVRYRQMRRVVKAYLKQNSPPPATDVADINRNIQAMDEVVAPLTSTIGRLYTDI